jgi:hypothetical protein
VTTWRSREAAKVGIPIARAALGSTLPGPEFVARVVDLAEAGGGRAHVSPDPSFPALLVLRGDTLIVAHVGSGPASYKVQEWLAAFSRIKRVETCVFVARDGLDGPEAVLKGDRLAQDGPPPLDDPDGGKRGD